VTKGEIIENVVKEMRDSSTHTKRRRPSEEDEEERDVINHLEKLLRDAQPDTNILTCTDFTHLNVECCTQCHYFMFPYDMCQITRLRSGEYLWVCCAIDSAIKRASGGAIPVKSPFPEQPMKSAGYKPFADFFGGKGEDNDAK
jgi:hypothetical protein